MLKIFCKSRNYAVIIALVLLGLAVWTGSVRAQTYVPQSREDIKLSFAPLVEKVSPAVVSVTTQRVVSENVHPFMNDPFFRRFFGDRFGGMSRQRIENSLGSGVIVQPDGLVVTNAHVIRQAREITVVLNDGRELEAETVLVDEPSDIALLQINDGVDKNLPHATLKPSESLKVGDLVLAIGNPFGVGQTVTSGIVSALARSSLNINDFNFFIQTDAAINPGNSGGPLVAMDGGVVGINTAIYSRTGGSLGIGFAVPSEMVATIIAAAESGQVDESGIVRPWLGVSVQDVTSDIAQSLGLKRAQGALISDLHPASPARRAGLERGDVVLNVNGHDIRSAAEMKFRLATIPIGEQARITFTSGGRKQTARVEAVAPPEDPPRNETTLSGRSPLSGAKVANINPAVAADLGMDNLNKEGVVVMDIGRGTQSARFLRPGDIILELNNRAIENVEKLKSRLQANPAAWEIIIERAGRKRRILVR